MRQLSQTTLDRWFKILAAVKAFDGLVESITGVVLLAIPAAQIKGAIATLAINEIQEGKRAFIAHYVLTLDQRLNVHIQLFAAIYLLAHGLIKLGLATALLKRAYQFFPYAIGFLLVFVGYQSYLVGYNRSWLLAGLTLFDLGLAGLTYSEWQRHRKANKVGV